MHIYHAVVRVSVFVRFQIWAFLRGFTTRMADVNYDIEKEVDPSSSSLLAKSSHTLENGNAVEPNVSSPILTVLNT